VVAVVAHRDNESPNRSEFLKEALKAKRPRMIARPGTERKIRNS